MCPHPETPAHRQKRMHHTVDVGLLVTQRHDGPCRHRGLPASGPSCGLDGSPGAGQALVADLDDTIGSPPLVRVGDSRRESVVLRWPGPVHDRSRAVDFVTPQLVGAGVHGVAVSAAVEVPAGFLLFA